jgi:hypothetical protein
MLDVPVKIPKETYDLIVQLLKTGRVDFENKYVDISGLQQLTVQQGVLQFHPPIKVGVKVGPITIKTTIPFVKVRGSSLEVEIENSPIDIKILPE